MSFKINGYNPKVKPRSLSGLCFKKKSDSGFTWAGEQKKKYMLTFSSKEECQCVFDVIGEHLGRVIHQLPRERNELDDYTKRVFTEDDGLWVSLVMIIEPLLAAGFIRRWEGAKICQIALSISEFFESYITHKAVSMRKQRSESSVTSFEGLSVLRSPTTSHPMASSTATYTCLEYRIPGSSSHISINFPHEIALDMLDRYDLIDGQLHQSMKRSSPKPEAVVPTPTAHHMNQQGWTPVPSSVPHRTLYTRTSFRLVQIHHLLLHSLCRVNTLVLYTPFRFS